MYAEVYRVFLQTVSYVSSVVEIVYVILGVSVKFYNIIGYAYNVQVGRGAGLYSSECKFGKGGDH